MDHLVDYIYHRDRIALVLYDAITGKFRLWQALEQDHFPYAYVRFQGMEDELDNIPEEAVGYEIVERYHPTWKKDASFLKVNFKSPHEVGQNMSGEEFLENKIKYFTRYAVDKKIDYGMQVVTTHSAIKSMHRVMPDDFHDLAFKLHKEGFEPDLVCDLLELLLWPVPDMPYLCMDIEVQSRGNVVPNPKMAAEPVISVAFKGKNVAGEGIDGLVIALDRKTRGLDFSINKDLVNAIKAGELKLELFDDERKMLQCCAMIMGLPDYRLILTFNGDRFDLYYLRNRMYQLGVRSNLRHRTFVVRGQSEHEVFYEPREKATWEPFMEMWKLHFDIYKFVSKAYIKDYAFRGKYAKNDLDTVGRGIVGLGKIPHEEGINDLSVHDLCWYNYRDVVILDELMKHGEGTILKLVFLMMRLGVEPFSECHRKAISSKIFNFLLKYINKHRWILPRRVDLRALDEAAYAALKLVVDYSSKYKGAIIIDPLPGAYFDVKCEDFTGLYTNVIWKYNLSFETMNCGHEECLDNVVPEVGHHVCTKVKGLMSQVIGLITTARKIHFKPAAKENPLLGPIEQALKVYGNAGYGVFGARFFPLFLRCQAESNTAWARHALEQVMEEVKRQEMLTVYGDTDSLFIHGATDEKLADLSRFSEETLGLELNLDYDLRLFVISQRKKNYLGIKYDGEPVVKGFKIKKRNTPPIISRAGMDVIRLLGKAKDEQKLKTMKSVIVACLKQYYDQIWRVDGPIEDYAFTTQVTMPIRQYKVIGAHVRAALMEARYKIKQLPEGISANPEDLVEPGTMQPFIKSWTTVGKGRISVLPLLLAEKDDVDPGKYHKELVSSVDQIIDVLGITEKDYRTLDPAKKTIGSFF